MIRSQEDKLDNRIVCDNFEIIQEMNKLTISMASKYIFTHEKNDSIATLIGTINNKK